MFQRALARYGLYTFAWLFKRLPYGFVRFCSGILIAIGFRCTIRKRKIAEESLDIAFGNEKSAEEKKAIVKKCFENFGRGMTEMLYYMAHPQAVDQKIVFQGKEHLDQACAQNRGVIAVTAHYGNFPLMMLACAQMGYNASSIIRQTRDEELSDYLEKKRTEVGLKTIYSKPRQKCVIESLKELRNNGLVFIPIDQNFGSGGGVYVNFFGQKAATARQRNPCRQLASPAGDPAGHDGPCGGAHPRQGGAAGPLGGRRHSGGGEGSRHGLAEAPEHRGAHGARGLPGDDRPGGERGPRAGALREGGPVALAGPSAQGARRGDEPGRPPARRRRGEVLRRASSGLSVGKARRQQNETAQEAEQQVHRARPSPGQEH